MREKTGDEMVTEKGRKTTGTTINTKPKDAAAGMYLITQHTSLQPYVSCYK